MKHVNKVMREESIQKYNCENKGRESGTFW